jgi:putative ubiquitin-RnfH superfamily antitoxin RatB of RatAB toxin-antitoxin module
VDIEFVDARGEGSPACRWLSLAPGAQVREALAAAGLPTAAEALAALAVGLHGRRCGLDDVLEDGDRVELYAPLRVDPKQARRLRARAGKR